MPETPLEWLHYRDDIAINVGKITFSALDIEHKILLAKFQPPKIPNPYTETMFFFNKFNTQDERNQFTITTKIKDIIFGIFLPTVYYKP